MTPVTPDQLAVSQSSCQHNHQKLMTGNIESGKEIAALGRFVQLALEVAAGEVIYGQDEIPLGFPGGRPKFSRQPESRALADIQKL
jgi:hypothetical protein